MSAALEPDRWLGALEVLARTTGAEHGQLIGIGAGREIGFNLVTNFDEQALRTFAGFDGGSPYINFRVAAAADHIARGRYDPILHEHHYDEAKARLHSRIYVDFCDHLDIPFGCQTNLVLDGGGLIGLATLRTRKQGRTHAADRRHFAKAAQAARRAARLQERLEGEQAKLLAGAFEAIGICAFLIDQGGRLLAHTQRADTLLSNGDVALANGVLTANGRPMTLRAAIQALVQRENGQDHVRLQIDLPPDRPTLLMEGFRLPQSRWSLGRLPFAVLIANPPRKDRAGVTGFLSALYGLSPGEADIALRLLERKSRTLIAEERGVTRETLRGQIKTVYRKCGVDGEASLIGLLAAIIA